MLKRIILIITGLVGAIVMFKGLMPEEVTYAIENNTFNYYLWIGLTLLLVAGFILMYIEIKSVTRKR